MKKKIIILGSTGSIGRTTFNIIKKNKKLFDVCCLSTNSNISLITKQAKELKIKNLIINDVKAFNLAIKIYKNSNFNFYNSFSSILKIIKKKKIDYTMIAISGLDALRPTLQMIRFSKNIAIANKESLICGWKLIDHSIKKYKTNFIPIDSEHFSIFTLMNNSNISNVDKIYITASGGPFLNLNLNKFKNISINKALKHPNWKMGKKITVDSSTMMNKVFEVIEAKNIFNLNYNQIKILTHPKSYVHAIVKFKTGFSTMLIHEPNMSIPIQNSIEILKNKFFLSKGLNFKILNKINFSKVNLKKFPLVKLLRKLPNENTLYETILLSINDFFVLKFLEKKITYLEMINYIYKFANFSPFLKYKRKIPQNVNEIYLLRDYVYLKLDNLRI